MSTNNTASVAKKSTGFSFFCKPKKPQTHQKTTIEKPIVKETPKESVKAETTHSPKVTQEPIVVQEVTKTIEEKNDTIHESKSPELAPDYSSIPIVEITKAPETPVQSFVPEVQTTSPEPVQAPQEYEEPDVEEAEQTTVLPHVIQNVLELESLKEEEILPRGLDDDYSKQNNFEPVSPSTAVDEGTWGFQSASHDEESEKIDDFVAGTKIDTIEEETTQNSIDTEEIKKQITLNNEIIQAAETIVKEQKNSSGFFGCCGGPNKEEIGATPLQEVVV